MSGNEVWKSEDMGTPRRRGKDNIVGKEIQGNMRCPLQEVWVPHCMTGPGQAAHIVQLSQTFPSERLWEEGKEGIMKVGLKVGRL